MTVAPQEAFVEPGKGAGLLDVLRRRFLARLLVRKELRVRYRGSFLGLLWSYVKPAVQFVVFYFAVGVFLRMNENVEDFAVYLFSGVVAVNFFSEAFGNATRSIVGNAALVKKIYLPRELFPVASVWVAVVHFLPQLVVLILGALIAGWQPSLFELGAGVLGIVIIAVLSLGLGLLFGALNVLFRDAENIVDLMLMVATWLSPVLYQWQNVRDAIGDGVLWWIYQANPMTAAVELFHLCFWFPGTDRTGAMPPGLLWSTISAVVLSFLVLLAGQVVFRRLDGRFAQEL
ncbi:MULTISPECIES: ABC transporter permease [Cellulosimicrobium]|uniref:Transport permease protein n=1 Tax=Cellulosimicrobium sp. ES-005 TaxID=3163031 RepID=A0AAU8G4B0_9MICO|nr:ABC transporter permease [Cellulosimicrobium cellulans]MCO7274298.1 ABC transporter permease [Cellulosimicrobium cellulans]